MVVQTRPRLDLHGCVGSTLSTDLVVRGDKYVCTIIELKLKGCLNLAIVLPSLGMLAECERSVPCVRTIRFTSSLPPYSSSSRGRTIGYRSGCNRS